MSKLVSVMHDLGVTQSTLMEGGASVIFHGPSGLVEN